MELEKSELTIFINMFMVNPASYAYSTEEEMKGWDQNTHVDTLDFHRSDLNQNINLDNWDNLIRFRSSACQGIHKVILSNLPLLTTIDLSNCSRLTSITVVNCPSLRALDVSFNGRLATIEGDFPSLEYLSMPEVPATPPSAPNLLYLDCSFTSAYLEFSRYPKLEVFHQAGASISKAYILSNISPSIRVFDLRYSNRTIEFDSLPPGSQLQAILYDNPLEGQHKGIFSFLPKKSVIPIISQKSTDIPEITNCSYIESASLLYGPWGVPKIDLIPYPETKPLQNIDPAASKAGDYCLGAIFGMAMLDMLGLGVEFDPTPYARIFTPKPMSIAWNHATVSQHTCRFLRGTSTDDTSQAILIMRSIVDSNKVPGKIVQIDLKDFGSRLIHWMYHGHEEHRHPGGLGLGRTVMHVLTHDRFLKDPIETAKYVWIQGNKNLAANGSVMRTGPIGCLFFWNDNLVMNNAKLFGQVTHYDPRCVFSTVVISLIIAKYIQKHTGLYSPADDNALVDECITKAKEFVGEDLQEYMKDIDYYCNCKTPADLGLGESKSIGYCLKAVGCGIWAARNCSTFEESATALIPEGGDSDTNGAVFGAVMGAKVGFSNLPKELLDYMFEKEWIMREAKAYLGLMGIQI